MDALNFIRAIAKMDEAAVKGKMVELNFPTCSLNQGVKYTNGVIVSNPINLTRPASLVGTVMGAVPRLGSPLDPVAIVSQDSIIGYTVSVLELVEHLTRICETGIVITLTWELGDNSDVRATSALDGRLILPSMIGQKPPYGSGRIRTAEVSPGQRESSCLVLSDNDSHWVAYPSPSNSY